MIEYFNGCTLKLIVWIACVSLGSLHASEKNYYELLGVSDNASRNEIRKAFHEVIFSVLLTIFMSIVCSIPP